MCYYYVAGSLFEVWRASCRAYKHAVASAVSIFLIEWIGAKIIFTNYPIILAPYISSA